jgi:hypothetical protein
MARSDRFFRDLPRRIARFGVTYVRPSIPSRTLRKALNVLQDTPTRAFIQIPHYWALYVHDGRAPFSAPPGRLLVWFRDPKDDPRLSGGISPVRANQLRQLTPSQFYFWLTQNAIARAEGRDPPMIVTRHVRKRTPGAHFFENDGGMRGFAEAVSEKFNPEVQKELTRQLAEGGLLDINEKATIRL